MVLASIIERLIVHLMKELSVQEIDPKKDLSVPAFWIPTRLLNSFYSSRVNSKSSSPRMN